MVERTVDPLGLVLEAGTWYLVAAHRGQPRTYRQVLPLGADAEVLAPAALREAVAATARAMAGAYGTDGVDGVGSRAPVMASTSRAATAR